MRIGIVGLPNAGKSSLFNALTGAGAAAASYAFTTVDPNVAVVAVPDDRLERVADVVGAAYAANTAVKLLVRRARPLLEDLPPLAPTPTSLSYPSSHACTSFAAARVLAGRLPPRPLYAVAAAMALSRPYLGLHYPSDALAGAALGLALAPLVR